jgi:UDP-glucose 4-epimerase
LLETDVALPETFAALPGDIDLIVHLAAKKIPRYGNALETLTVNYEGTRATLEFARRLGCKCVLASTSDVYGRNPDVPFSEAHSDSVIGSSKSARWAYAVSKLFDEHLALAYQEEYGFHVTLLRFFGSYGPRQILGWRGGPQSVFIDAVLRGEPMTIHGDGLQTRTFTYIDDTVEGTYRAMMSPDADGEILNIGGTEEVTILDLANRIKALSGTPGELELEFVPYESFTGKSYQDVMRRVPDVKLAEHILGFRAETSLDDGLRATIEWQREVSR